MQSNSRQRQAQGISHRAEIFHRKVHFMCQCQCRYTLKLGASPQIHVALVRPPCKSVRMACLSQLTPSFEHATWTLPLPFRCQKDSKASSLSTQHIPALVLCAGHCSGRPQDLLAKIGPCSGKPSDGLVTRPFRTRSIQFYTYLRVLGPRLTSFQRHS